MWTMGPRFLFKLHVVEKIIITTENSVNSVTLVHVYTSVLKSMNLLPTWPLKHERHQPGLNCDVIMFFFFFLFLFPFSLSSLFCRLWRSHSWRDQPPTRPLSSAKRREETVTEWKRKTYICPYVWSWGCCLWQGDSLSLSSLYTQYTFSILFLIHFLRCWQGEFV